jgi:hypothetical protein
MIENIIKKILNEATSTSTGSGGSYIAPLEPGIRIFKDIDNQPFTMQVSNYDSPYLEYDSYDGSMKTPKKQIKKIERTAKKITNYIKNHPNSTLSDEDGGPINQFPGKNKKIVPIKEWVNLDDIVLNEATHTSVTAGAYTGPIELGLKKWKKSELGPFYNFIDTDFNHKEKQKTLKNNINRVVGVWEKGKDGTYDVDIHDVHTINEDLAVWFGTKKKPKGSKQPKGPWVNICRKVDGKHPPCGRHDTGKGAYPKCRAAGVAGKMSDSEKKSACQQKRRAEKKDTQTGKGQKPIMTSYKKNKINENMKKIVRLTENDLNRIVRRVLMESEESMTSDQGRMGEYIRNDFKKEKNKKLIVRTKLTEAEYQSRLQQCIKEIGDSVGCQKDLSAKIKEPWVELIYGYAGPVAGQERKMVITKGSVKEPGYMIEYDCTSGEIFYKKVGGESWNSNVNDDNQKEKDKNWLIRWCNSIDTWTSRVGQERKLFRNPKSY